MIKHFDTQTFFWRREVFTHADTILKKHVQQ